MATKSPASQRISLSPSVTFCAVIVTVPPSGMASRELITRLTSAISNSPMSTVIGHTSGGISIVSLTLPPSPLERTSRIDSIRSRDLDRLRIEPLPPRERQQLPGQGGAALSGELDRLRGARGLRILCGESSSASGCCR